MTQRGDLGVFQNLDQGIGADNLGQPCHQRGTGAVAAGMDDPRPGVCRLEPHPE